MAIKQLPASAFIRWHVRDGHIQYLRNLQVNVILNAISWLYFIIYNMLNYMSYDILKYVLFYLVYYMLYYMLYNITICFKLHCILYAIFTSDMLNVM